MFGCLAVRDHVDPELLGLASVHEHRRVARLSLLDFVRVFKLSEAVDLSQDVLLVVVHFYESADDPLSEVLVLDPLGELAPLYNHFLELF